MVHKLYEYDAYRNKRTLPGLLEHFFDTLTALGGVKGLLGITVAVLIFYSYVNYVVSNRHNQKAVGKQRWLE